MFFLLCKEGAINPTTFSSSFREWKFCKYELDQLMKKNFMECPSCSPNQHSAHVDGNMKLYRFRSAGKYVFIHLFIFRFCIYYLPYMILY